MIFRPAVIVYVNPLYNLDAAVERAISVRRKTGSTYRLTAGFILVAIWQISWDVHYCNSKVFSMAAGETVGEERETVPVTQGTGDGGTVT